MPAPDADERMIARRASRLETRIAVQALDPPDSPRFIDDLDIANRLAAARAAHDPLERARLIEQLAEDLLGAEAVARISAATDHQTNRNKRG